MSIISEATQNMLEILADELDLECDVIPAGTPVNIIEEKYYTLLKIAKESDLEFIPIIVVPSDTLHETLEMNLEEEDTAQMLMDSLIDGEEYFDLRRADNEEWEDEEEEVDTDEFEDVEFGGVDGFTSIFDFETDTTKELILVKIPNIAVWEVFAYLPFGGWNECPGTLEHMSIAKYWNDKYAAIPAVISSDTLEFLVNEITDPEIAKEVAEEHYLYCNDIVSQGVGTKENLAKQLMNSSVWFFWWD